MALSPEDQRRHAEYAEKARAELIEHWQDWKAIDVAEWWKRWAQFGKATHDVLARELMDVTGVKPKHRPGVHINFDE